MKLYGVWDSLAYENGDPEPVHGAAIAELARPLVYQTHQYTKYLSIINFALWV